MPYIHNVDRLDIGVRFLDRAEEHVWAGAYTVGAMNYIITRLLLAWIGRQPNYDKINAVVGLLECVKQEFYRRVAVPYEDSKAVQNGEVY